MKILRIIARLNVGGPARHVTWLTEALNDGEFESRLIAGTVPPGEEDMGYLADEAGIRPLFIKEMSRELSLKDAVSLWKIYREVRRFRPDIIHTHTAKAGTVGRAAGILYRWLTPGALIGRPRNVRLVHTFHGHVFHSYYGEGKTRVFLAIERFLARFTDRIVVISEKQREEISRDFAVGRPEQFHVIPLGIDLAPLSASQELRDKFRREVAAADDEILIGFVGRLTEIKNIPLLLRAFASVAGKMSRARLIIAGDGHLRTVLESLTEELGITDRVTFLGNRGDIATVYAGVDIVALSSLNEGTPLSLIEAMAAGKPIISTYVGGVRDLLGTEADPLAAGVTRYERGLGVPSGDDAALAEGLRLLAADPALRAQLAERGQTFVQNNYSKKRLIDDIKNLYRELAR